MAVVRVAHSAASQPDLGPHHGTRDALVETLQMPLRQSQGRGSTDSGANSRTGLLVVSEELNAPGMSWVTTERRRQEEPNHLQGLLAGMHPGADADHVRVVVLSTELCRVQVVCE